MKSIIKSAKTIDEAVNLGLKELGISRDDAEISVMQEPSKGVFGIFGGSDAVVKIKKKENESFEAELDQIFSESGFNRNDDEIYEADEENKFAKFDDDSEIDEEEVFVEEEVYLEDINEDEEDFDLTSEETSYEEVVIKEEITQNHAETSSVEEESQESIEEVEANLENESEEDELDGLYEEGYEPEFEKEEEVQEDVKDEDSNYEIFSSDESSLVNTRELEFSGQAQQITDGDSLEEVAKKAKTILEDILVKMHIETKVGYETARDNIINFNLSDISENDTGIVIGAKGETLNAVQYVLSLLINKETSKFYRVTVNVGNYRDRRKKNIESNAQRVAYKVLKTKKAVALKPMNSFERRIVHTALQSYKEIETVSSGKFPNRKVVIRYKGL